MTIKQLSLYKTEDHVEFNYQKVYEHVHTPLSELQQEKVGFVSLFKEDEVMFTKNVEGYSIFKVGITKRKPVKADTVEREFTRRLQKLSQEEASFDMDVLLGEVNKDLTRTSDQTHKEALVVFDHRSNMFMIDASRTDAEDCMSLLHNLYEDAEFEVVLTDAHNMQNMLTSYVMKESDIPEPFVLGEYTELAKPVKIGAKATGSTVVVKKEPCACDEVKNHLKHNKRINKLELDYDGVLFFKIDTTFFINGLSFEEDLKYKENRELSEEDNMVAHWLVALPEVSKAVSILLNDLNKDEV